MWNQESSLCGTCTVNQAYFINLSVAETCSGGGVARREVSIGGTKRARWRSAASGPRSLHGNQKSIINEACTIAPSVLGCWRLFKRGPAWSTRARPDCPGRKGGARVSSWTCSDPTRASSLSPPGCGPARSTSISAGRDRRSGQLLRRAIEADRLSSLILWGPRDRQDQPRGGHRPRDEIALRDDQRG